MFGLLKAKLSGFLGKLTAREESKPAAELTPPQATPETLPPVAPFQEETPVETFPPKILTPEPKKIETPVAITPSSPELKPKKEEPRHAISKPVLPVAAYADVPGPRAPTEMTYAKEQKEETKREVVDQEINSSFELTPIAPTPTPEKKAGWSLWPFGKKTQETATTPEIKSSLTPSMKSAPPIVPAPISSPKPVESFTPPSAKPVQPTWTAPTMAKPVEPIAKMAEKKEAPIIPAPVPIEMEEKEEVRHKPVEHPKHAPIEASKHPTKEIEKHAPKHLAPQMQKHAPAHAPEVPTKHAPITPPKHASETPLKHAPASHKPKAPIEMPVESGEPVHSDKELERLGKRALSDEEREMKVKMGLGKSVLGFFTPTVTVGEDDVRDLLEELELELLESDVAYEVSAQVTARLRAQLVGAKVPKSEVQAKVAGMLHQVLADVMSSPQQFDFVKRVKEMNKPAKVLFVGPNGAGKTTTMAKIARRLQEAGLTVVFSASDTFRAAAIEQTEVHAARLGIPVIKSGYGADPAAVAFDAVKYAKAHKIDVVLIDSAGRQDTNANLLGELKKINRIIQPDLKIYIGESIGGNALIEQIRGFHSAIGIDGAILTKLDCDSKGGTAISLTHATGGVPILFLGTGQNYEDLVAFDAKKVAHQILT